MIKYVVFIVTADMKCLINSNIRGDGWCQLHCAVFRCLHHFILHEYSIPSSAHYQCQTHSQSQSSQDQSSVSIYSEILDRRMLDQTGRCYGCWIIVMTGVKAASPSDTNCIGSVWFTSIWLNPKTLSENCTSASQNWNLKLTRFIEIETSNINELSLNFIDKLRLF